MQINNDIDNFCDMNIAVKSKKIANDKANLIDIFPEGIGRFFLIGCLRSELISSESLIK